MDISYVAAVLEKKHNVLVIDVPNEGWELLEEIEGGKYRQGLPNTEIVSRIQKFQPQLIVISVPYSGWSTAAFDVAKTIKSATANQNIKIALIGLHASSRPNECLTQANVDFVVIGEPEITILELANTIETGHLHDLKNVAGLSFIENNQIITTAPRPFIENLDELPFPARHL
ncbi:MAG: cobalamin-dependent protein, partial [Candidatus Bathyarchaeota archaeon]|nr:cobalamin-dependent protein [Candidatus Termiticorpusculum sp.]